MKRTANEIPIAFADLSNRYREGVFKGKISRESISRRKENLDRKSSLLQVATARRDD